MLPTGEEIRFNDLNQLRYRSMSKTAERIERAYEVSREISRGCRDPAFVSIPPRFGAPYLVPTSGSVVRSSRITTLPLWLFLALVATPFVPGRWRPLRLLAMALVYLIYESIGIILLTGLWVGSGFGRSFTPNHAGAALRLDALVPLGHVSGRRASVQVESRTRQLPSPSSILTT